jgi:hypothetical protein
MAKIKKKCEWCKKEFQLEWDYLDKKRRFCSTKCRLEWLIKYLKENTKKIIKICPQCQKEFKVYHHRAKTQGYCSKKCRGQKTKKICEICKKKYYVRRCKLASRFCSSKCYGKWLSKNQKGKNHPNWKTKTKKRCWTCKKEFFVRPSAKSRVCCSQKCYYERRAKFYIGQKSPVWKKKLKKICLFCKKRFEVIPAHAYQKHCSANCYYEWMSKYQVGKNNPTWSGGNKKYCEGWTEQIRRKIRERDEYTCQICKKHANQLKHKLSIHHIDYNKTHINIKNLISLCKKCHGYTNSNKRKLWKTFFQNYLSKKYGYVYLAKPKIIKKQEIMPLIEVVMKNG